MTEENNCPHCGKKLRSNNTRGVCSDCFKSGKRLDGAAAAAAGDEAPPATKKRSTIESRKSFAVVARALGEDPDALINGFCESWLDDLKAKRADADKRHNLDGYISPLER